MRSEKYRKANRSRLVLLLALTVLVLFAAIKFINFASWYTPVHVSDEGFSHAEQFAGCVAVNGIDVSEFQGEDIKWKKVKASGVDFAFIRAGYRSVDTGNLNADSTFDKNIQAAQRVGIMTGAYFYSQAITPDEAIEEAEYAIELVKAYDLELPLVIDFEIYSGGRLDKAISGGTMNYAQAYHDIVLAFCETVEAAGYDSGIYANTDMLTHYMDASLIDDASNLWVAEFSSSCSLNSGYRWWQCSDSTEIGGTDKTVDHDFMYINTAGVTKLWYVNPGKRVSMEKCRVKLKKDSVKYKRSGAEVKAIVTDPEGRRMREGKDYTLSYVNNTERGTAYAVVRGINGYRDIITAEYDIE